MKKLDLKQKFELLVETYRYYIGAGLVVLILIGGIFLLWRENYFQPDYETKLQIDEGKIEQLENDLNAVKSEARNSKSETSSNAQSTNSQNSQSQEQGVVAGASTSNSASQKSASQPVSGKVNINTATAAQLDTLPGIGTTYAQRIIDYRNMHGGFKTLDEIKNVKGIGDATFSKLKDKISI